MFADTLIWWPSRNLKFMEFSEEEKSRARATLSDKRLEGSTLPVIAPGSLQVGQFSAWLRCSFRES